MRGLKPGRLDTKPGNFRAGRRSAHTSSAPKEAGGLATDGEKRQAALRPQLGFCTVSGEVVAVRAVTSRERVRTVVRLLAVLIPFQDL